MWKAVKMRKTIAFALVSLQVYNFASVLSRGASFWVSMMLPAIFNFPFMNAA